MKKLIVFGLALLVVSASIVAGEPALLGAVALLPLAMPMSLSLGVSGVDVSAISAYAAAYQAPLISSLVNGLKVQEDMMVLSNVKNKVPMPKLTVGKGFRPYGPNNDYKSKDIAYTDRYLNVGIGKRDLLIDPEDYRPTYFAWVNAPGAPANRKDIPFAAFLWNQVIKSLQAEINDMTAWKGFDKTTATAFDSGIVYTYSSSTPQYITYASTTNNPNNVVDYWKLLATTTAGQTPDSAPTKWQNVSAAAVTVGLESLIKTEITGSTIAPVATGAITDGASAVSAFTQMHRSFTPAYKDWGIIQSCSHTDFEYLMDGLLTTYWKYTKGDAKPGDVPSYLVLPNTNGKGIVKPASWIGASGSRRIVAGPLLPGDDGGRQMNLYLGTDLLSDANSIEVLTQSKLYTIEAGVKVSLAFQIQDVSAIKVNDQV